MRQSEVDALEFGGEVAELRQRLGLSQLEFGRRVNLSGTRISQIETGRKPANAETRARIRWLIARQP